jgi:hypothetical protein
VWERLVELAVESYGLVTTLLRGCLGHTPTILPWILLGFPRFCSVVDLVWVRQTRVGRRDGRGRGEDPTICFQKKREWKRAPPWVGLE